jgi:hypothetical protein
VSPATVMGHWQVQAQCRLAGGIDVAATLPGDPDPAGHSRARHLQEMDHRIVRTWRSGFPERHVRTNSIKARDADIYLEIGHPAECRHPHTRTS